jgi:5-methylcytosine-specific restriction endonuclease McrA
VDVVTSRTGTAKYLRNSARVKREARRAGLTHCPGVDDKACGRELDYETPRLDGSAEADHILEVRYGGTDDVENLRVICRSCNLGRNKSREPVPVADVDAFPLSREW